MRLSSPRRSGCAKPSALLALLLGLAAAEVAHAADPPLSPPRVDPAHVFALLINGGGNPDSNYSSHVRHLERMLATLDAAGVPRAHVSVFASDGSNPADDVASRSAEPESFGWLEDTRLGERLRPPLELSSTTLPNVTVAPATRAQLDRWFARARGSLHAGDTLLVYVTDHGEDDAKGPDGNRIVLWGAHEGLSVRELRAWLGRLHPGVRVVSVMSQCFSGGFAGLSAGEPRACGYFSSTWDRPAYGCYPESNSGSEEGHSFELLAALAATGGDLAAAHREVLTRDRTPDVPLRSSDAFLEATLAAAAGRADLNAFADAQLALAFADRGRWEPELRLLDRLGQSFGMASARSLAAITADSNRLAAVSKQLEDTATLWQESISDTSEGLLRRFLAARGDWAVRLAPLMRRGPRGEDERHAILAELLAAYVPWAEADRGAGARLIALRARRALAEEAGYRLEVRRAALLRMRAVLIGIAARTYLAAHRDPRAEATLQTLTSCEDVRLPLPPHAPAAALAAYPTVEDDTQLSRTALPAWMGIEFRAVSPARRAREALTDGAAQVMAVRPRSPAERAGLRAGDVVLGPPDAPFVETNEVRTWTRLLTVGKPAPLVLLRGSARVTTTLLPEPFPVDLPLLSGPPRRGSAAPALVGTSFRGEMPGRLDDGKTRVLFFWATFCAPCKASVPSLLAYARAHDATIVAVTDEAPETLQGFFQRYRAPFPEAVVSDVERRTLSAYGVSGTPTFVLVDGTGKVRSYAVGYDATAGLPLPP